MCPPARQTRARVLEELISVRLVSPFPCASQIRPNTPCKIIWSARQGDPDQPLLPADSPPKRRWRFASPNANSMPQGSSASAQRGEKQKEQVRQRRDKPTSCRLGAVNIPCISPRRWRILAAVGRALRCRILSIMCSGPRRHPATKTNRLVLTYLIPNKLETARCLPLGRPQPSAITPRSPRPSASCRFPIYQQTSAISLVPLL
jgi:hypothetical protein